MTKVYIIRHAQGFHNVDPAYDYRKGGRATESPLTSLGIMQSILLRKFITKMYKKKSKKIAVICSPYLRTLMTAFVSLEGLHKSDIFIDPSPGEINNPGLPINFLKKYFDKRFWNRLNFLGIDKNMDWSDNNNKDYLNRVVNLRNFVNKLKIKHNYDYILIYSHGSFMHYGFNAPIPGNTSVYKFNDSHMKSGKYVYHWQGHKNFKELTNGYSQAKIPIFSR